MRDSARRDGVVRVTCMSRAGAAKHSATRRVPVICGLLQAVGVLPGRLRVRCARLAAPSRAQLAQSSLPEQIMAIAGTCEDDGLCVMCLQAVTNITTNAACQVCV